MASRLKPEVCAPWVFVVFLAGAVAMLSNLGVKSDLSNFWEVAHARIWNGMLLTIPRTSDDHR